jgi:hypothetical protein
VVGDVGVAVVEVAIAVVAVVEVAIAVVAVVEVAVKERMMVF